MNRVSGRHLYLAGVAVMAVVGCSAGVWPAIDSVLTTVFGVVAGSLLLAVAAVVGRWMYREWLWRAVLRHSVPAPAPLVTATSDPIAARVVLSELVEVAS
jgi:hypothetical protein